MARVAVFDVITFVGWDGVAWLAVRFSGINGIRTEVVGEVSSMIVGLVSSFASLLMVESWIIWAPIKSLRANVFSRKNCSRINMQVSSCRHRSERRVILFGTCKEAKSTVFGKSDWLK